jgi:hypothetical protein
MLELKLTTVVRLAADNQHFSLCVHGDFFQVKLANIGKTWDWTELTLSPITYVTMTS